jgi:ABC-type glycerol-3-phosphate transport system substrate-binding protein
MLDAGTSEGTLHAVLAPEVRVLAIRDDIFEEAGVDPSASIDDPQELREIAEEVVQRDGDRIAVQGLDLKSGFNNEQEFFSFVGMMGQYQLWDEDLQPLLETPEAVAALEMMQSYFVEELSTYSDDLEMTDGLAAMGFQSSNAAIQLEDRFGGDITWQPMPGGNSVALGTFFTVSAYTDAPEVAVELFKEIMSPEGQMIILDKQGLLPTRASLQEEFVSLNDRNQVFFDGVQNAYVYGPINPYFFEFIDAVRPQIEEALYGMKSAEDALAAAAAYRAAID